MKHIGVLGNGITANAVQSFLKASDDYVEAPYKDADIIVTSPGIPPREWPKVNKEIISDIEFAYRIIKKEGKSPTIIGITGTNGKTTVTAGIAHALNTVPYGNIGCPLVASVNNMSDNDIVVIELSSFQLEHIKKFKPDISIILNLSPDHLDRYSNYNEYLSSKLNIIMNQDLNCTAIINKNITIIPKINKFELIRFKIIDSNKMSINNKIIKIIYNNSSLESSHNKENILAAYIVSKKMGINDNNIISSINSFKTLNHRIEKINLKSNINYYNDSKATNLNATTVAIESIKNNIILILGGVDKNKTDFSILKKYSNKIKIIIIYGESKEYIKHQISNHFKIYKFKKFKESVIKSIELSSSNLSVLLSPSCSSFDQFDNYIERGNYFKKIVLNYYDKE